MKTKTTSCPNQRLREERALRGWSQGYVATQIGAERYYISRWERGVVTPSAYYRAQLCTLFGKNARELGLLSETLNEEKPLTDTVTSSTQTSPVENQSCWYVPHRRNPFFTGREQLLALLHERFCADRPASLKIPLALCGLGGMGKTQIALEYVYRYRAEYQFVLWLSIETRETMLIGCSLLKDTLHLASTEENQDQQQLIATIRNWLSTSTCWLLILDNVEDIGLVKELLPEECNGHVLLTTRGQVTGSIAEPLKLEKMPLEESTLLLLRRAGLTRAGETESQVSPSVFEATLTLAEILDGLPLAIDQAAAYIEETQCSLLEFLNLFKHYSVRLFQERDALADHPVSLVKTIALAYEKIQQKDQAAANLLNICAFLAPDAIPLDMLITGASVLEPSLEQGIVHPLVLNRAIAVLRAYSLVDRNGEEHVLTIHRLVQATLRDTFEQSALQHWSNAVVQLVNRAFPNSGEDSTWSLYQRYLPHAQACVVLIEEQHIISTAAGQLLTKVGDYLQEHGQYAQAEQILKQGIIILRQTVGERHLDTAFCLNELGLLYHYQGNYAQAEPLYRQVLALREELLGAEHLDVTNSLVNLSALLGDQGQYTQAEKLVQRALAIREKALGPEHSDVAACLHNLAYICQKLGKYEQAEPLMQRAVAIRENVLGPEHLRTLRSMAILALLYTEQGKYVEAETLQLRVLATRKKQLGANHNYVGACLKNLASLYREQGKLVLAEEYCQLALTIYEQTVGLEHPTTLFCRDLLARIFIDQGKYAQAQPICTQVLTLRQQNLKEGHPLMAESYETLAMLYSRQGEYQQAEVFAVEALSAREQTPGATHPDVASSLSLLAEIAHLQGDYTRAEDLCQRAITIYQSAVASDHPKIQRSLSLLAKIYQSQGKSEQAQQLLLNVHQADRWGEKSSIEESDEQNPLHAFFATCCSFQPHAWCHSSDLWKSYQEWVYRSGERFPLHRRAFTHYLKMQGCLPDRTNTYRIWRGIALQ